MKDGAPVRFLLLLLGGWIGLRAAIVTFGGAGVEAEKGSAAAGAASPAFSPLDAGASVRPSIGPAHDGRVAAIAALPPVPFRRPMQRQFVPAGGANAVLVASPDRSLDPVVAPAIRSRPATPPAEQPVLIAEAPSVATARVAAPRRWSGSAWVLVRQSGGAALAPGGTLGGSQAGARLLYRINDDVARPFSLAARAYAPLRGLRGAEAALGFDWRPVARLPAHLLVERRQRLGRDGRSAFAATIYGGGAVALAPDWRIEGYAQAGIVGARSRDMFVDGSARFVRRFGPVETGAAVWGAAQPGASRLDAGPQLAVPLRAAGTSLRLSAEYRFRLAGDARPASGPTLTLGVDF